MPSDIDVSNVHIDTQVQLCKNPLSLTAGISNFRDFFCKNLCGVTRAVFFFVTDPRFSCHLRCLPQTFTTTIQLRILLLMKKNQMNTKNRLTI